MYLLVATLYYMVTKRNSSLKTNDRWCVQCTIVSALERCITVDRLLSFLGQSLLQHFFHLFFNSFLLPLAATATTPSL